MEDSVNAIAVGAPFRVGGSSTIRLWPIVWYEDSAAIYTPEYHVHDNSVWSVGYTRAYKPQCVDRGEAIVALDDQWHQFTHMGVAVPSREERDQALDQAKVLSGPGVGLSCNAVFSEGSKGGRAPWQATPRWLVDTGCGVDLVGKSGIRMRVDKFLHPCQDHISFQTANGRTMAYHKMKGHIPEFDMRVDPYVVEDSPALMSVGVRCMKLGMDLDLKVGQSVSHGQYHHTGRGTRMLKHCTLEHSHFSDRPITSRIQMYSMSRV